jgi:sterol desaturase/sphingolipid hydroxylase (fatty acid hydroxylase superfamily)
MSAALSKRRVYNLSRMSFRELTRAFLTYPTVLAYAALALAAIGVCAATMTSPRPLVPAVAVAVLVYPLAWYLLHRFVLHGRWMYKIPALAATWKRIHFDHHQDPNDLRVLFGALVTTLPTIALVTLPVGYAIGGVPAAAAALAAGIVQTIFYEFVHCVQHLNTVPKNAFLKRVKKLHMAHHFHNEAGNYGITNFLWDRLLGTKYETTLDRPRSATVFNIGYTEEEARRYPWVAALSGGRRIDDYRRPRDAATETPERVETAS